MSFPLQLFVGQSEPTLKKFKPAEDDISKAFIRKPKHGLWTSKYRPETNDSPWIEWCVANEFGDVENTPWWILEPKDDVKILEISDWKSFDEIIAKYGYNWMENISKDKFLSQINIGIKFESIMKDGYDAVHLTENAAWKLHNGRKESPFLNLNGWDCESTIWLKYSFKSVKELINAYN